ncbi:MAG TPA: hypothetical protein VFZ54_08445 [Burkholderiales bacterium]
MSKTIKLILAITALSAIAPAQSLRAEAPARWLVAQIASCTLDGRQVPAGANYCREGRLWVCSGSGTWSNTNKPC